MHLTRIDTCPLLGSKGERTGISLSFGSLLVSFPYSRCADVHGRMPLCGLLANLNSACLGQDKFANRFIQGN